MDQRIGMNNDGIHVVNDDGKAVLSTERATCARCGVEGWRGDWPSEDGIVSGGGETALGEYAHRRVCDPCAQQLMSLSDHQTVTLD